MRDHVTAAHPESLSEMTDLFKMRGLKAARSALSRQVREAVEISSTSHGLLNNKEEYSRCILPTLRVESPPSAKVQDTLAKPVITLTQLEEEKSLLVVRETLKKRAKDSKRDQESQNKRIKLNNNPWFKSSSNPPQSIITHNDSIVQVERSAPRQGANYTQSVMENYFNREERDAREPIQIPVDQVKVHKIYSLGIFWGHKGSY